MAVVLRPCAQRDVLFTWEPVSLFSLAGIPEMSYFFDIFYLDFMTSSSLAPYHGAGRGQENALVA